MIGARAQVRELFFDREAVHSAIDAKTRAMLVKFGSFTMNTARQSIRTRKKASAPGKPPSNHTGLLRDNIFFAFDPQKKSVVVGPVRLSNVTTGIPTNGETVPSVLEMGGTVTRPIQTKAIKHRVGQYGNIRLGGKANKTRSVRKLGAQYGLHQAGQMVARVKLTTPAMVDRADQLAAELAANAVNAFGGKDQITVTIGPRPFMVPAFNKELGVLDTLWQSAK